MTRSAEALLILWTGLCALTLPVSSGGEEGGLVAACHVLNTGFRMQADHDGALQ
jgi:hypothetical protein